MIKSQIWGKLEDGREVTLYTLTNENGMIAQISDFGAIVQNLFVPDKNGYLADVLLGGVDFAACVSGRAPVAMTVGRYANRIANASFTLGGVEYKLASYGAKHQLHGGRGFQGKLWTGAVNGDRLELTYVSADGEEGFPGRLEVIAGFELTNNNELILTYEAITDKPTYVNLTNHAYFNLYGGGTAMDNIVRIDADSYLDVDDELIPTRIAPVEGTIFDFREERPVGEAVYDHNFILNSTDRPQISCVDPKSGRALEITTTLPGVQLYTVTASRPGNNGKNGVSCEKGCAVCFETQFYPDSPNHPEYPSPRLDPGQQWKHSTVWHFYNLQ